jgi:hypothetical protein
MIKKLLFLMIVNTTILSMNQVYQNSISLIKNNISLKNSICMISGGLIKCCSKNNFEELLEEAKRIDSSTMSQGDKTILGILSGKNNDCLESVQDKKINQEIFLQKYKKHRGSKKNSPIAYRLKKKLGLNIFASGQYESQAGFHSGFLLNSIIYSLMYAPFYYFVIKMLIDHNKYPINPIHLALVSEALAILTKMSLKHISQKNDSQWWENCDQKYISLIYCFLIGRAMHTFKK